ncbi:MAG: hypothetical protein IKH99_05770, partial [Prevotella sp.]|nr:hypothetical protein [Prevotella sp.]
VVVAGACQEGEHQQEGEAHRLSHRSRFVGAKIRLSERNTKQKTFFVFTPEREYLRRSQSTN